MNHGSGLRYFSFVLLVAILVSGAASGQEYEGGFEPSVLPPRGGPFDLTVEVTTGPDGEPVLSQRQFLLARGGYYRLNLACPDVASDAHGFHFEATDLLANSHLRVVSVGQMEIYMQGMSFRAIQCDDAGSARFSFHPMRSGVYELHVHNIEDPSREATALIVVE